MPNIVDVPIGAKVRFLNRPDLLGIWRRVDDVRGSCCVRLLTPHEPETIEVVVPGEPVEIVDHLVDELLRVAEDQT